MTKVLPRAAARRTATDEKIGAAVRDLIRGEGLQAVTIDAVTARSGVAKTTIYRRYRDRFELLAGVLVELAPIPDYSEVDVTQDGLAAMVGEIREAFETHVGLAHVAELLTADEEFLCHWREKVVSPWLANLRGYLARGKAEGVLDPDVDYAVVIEMILGGMVICDALRGGVPDDWATGVVDTIWPRIHRR